MSAYPIMFGLLFDAIEKHGLLKGLVLGTNRLLRCRPGGTSGHDPVPDENQK